MLVRDNTRQWLVDFVRDRGGQCAKRRDPCQMGELRSEPAERVFRKSTLRHVLNRADVLELTVVVLHPMGDDVHVVD